MGHDAPVLSDLPRFVAASGNLSFMQVRDHIPFEIDHVSWIDWTSRAGAGNDDDARSSEAVIVPLSGGFTVELDDGSDQRQVRLDRADQSLYVPEVYRWALRERSSGCIALVVESGARQAAEAGTVAALPEAMLPIDAGRSTIDDCAVIELPVSAALSGRSSMLRSEREGDLKFRRVYYLTDIAQGASRGGHAHRELHQFVVAASGSFDVHIDDGTNKRSITLSRPDRALRLVPGIWRVLHSFSTGSICLVVASRPYEEDDYLRRYRDFRAFKGR